MSRDRDAALPVPQGDYSPASRHGGLIYTAGMTPRTNGRMMFDGPVRTAEIAQHRKAVRLACANALLAAEDKLNDGEEIAALLTMTVYIAAEDGFREHSKIADFASAYLLEKLGERGICSRCALGVANLPGGAPVEIQLVATV